MLIFIVWCARILRTCCVWPFGVWVHDSFRMKTKGFSVKHAMFKIPSEVPLATCEMLSVKSHTLFCAILMYVYDRLLTQSLCPQKRLLDILPKAVEGTIALGTLAPAAVATTTSSSFGIRLLIHISGRGGGRQRSGQGVATAPPMNVRDGMV